MKVFFFFLFFRWPNDTALSGFFPSFTDKCIHSILTEWLNHHSNVSLVATMKGEKFKIWKTIDIWEQKTYFGFSDSLLLSLTLLEGLSFSESVSDSDSLLPDGPRFLLVFLWRWSFLFFFFSFFFFLLVSWGFLLVSLSSAGSDFTGLLFGEVNIRIIFKRELGK